MRSWPKLLQIARNYTMYIFREQKNFANFDEFNVRLGYFLYPIHVKINKEFSRKIGNANNICYNIYLIIPSCSLCFLSRSWILLTDTSREVVRLSLSSSRLWINKSHPFVHKNMFKKSNFSLNTLYSLSSNVKNKTTNITCFRNETKTFSYRSRICLNENRLFWFVPESLFLDQIEMISFDKTSSGWSSNVLVSFLLDIGTFVDVYKTFVSLLFWHYIPLCTISWVFSFPRPGKAVCFLLRRLSSSFFILIISL